MTSRPGALSPAIFFASTALAFSLSAPAWSQSASKAALDPAATQAALRMGEHLRGLKSFEVKSDATIEYVRDGGQKVSVPTTVTYKVRRPDAFTIDMVGPKTERRYIYDGRSFTVFAPKPGYFATVSAPATIRETADLIYAEHGVVLPLADLFYWGEGASPMDGVTSASVVGREKVAGQDTEHYRYGGKGLTWDIWMQRGAQPLPVKMRIVTADDPAQPAYTANLTWTPSATFAADAFTFTPSRDAKPIAMARVEQ